MSTAAPSAGAVVIGRNEGALLRASLTSVCEQFNPVVYVDSGSRDDSIAIARGLATAVVELDRSAPFTAGRARNAGAAWLRHAYPDLQFIQFIDGDCQLAPGWAAEAIRTLEADRRLAVVCGRRREVHPDRSPYNRLCDLEWDLPVGDTLSCGGDAMMRAEALHSAGGFAPELIAGEEPDLCFRLRRAGWRLQRVAATMSLHDAAILRFSQWWTRDRRSGFAAAEAFARRGREEPGLLRRVVSNVIWALPLAWPFWPLLWLKMYRRRGPLYASFIVLGKLPHAVGQINYWINRHANLIEYK